MMAHASWGERVQKAPENTSTKLGAWGHSGTVTSSHTGETMWGSRRFKKSQKPCNQGRSHQDWLWLAWTILARKMKRRWPTPKWTRNKVKAKMEGVDSVLRSRWQTSNGQDTAFGDTRAAAERGESLTATSTWCTQPEPAFCVPHLLPAPCSSGPSWLFPYHSILMQSVLLSPLSETEAWKSQATYMRSPKYSNGHHIPKSGF